MGRDDVTIWPPRADRLGILPRLLKFAEDHGWRAIQSNDRATVLVQDFEDDAAAAATMRDLDDVLSTCGSFRAVVR